ncbi:MAG: hypothetical protein ACP5OS_03300 [Leptospirillia bacterium]
MAYVEKKGEVELPSGRFLIFGRVCSMSIPEEWHESQRIGWCRSRQLSLVAKNPRDYIMDGRIFQDKKSGRYEVNPP